VLQRVHEVIRDFEQSYGSAANMLLDCSQGVLKQKGLIASIGAKGGSVISARMSLLDLYRASNRMLVLDHDGEDFAYAERTFAGIDAVLSLFMLRMSAAARMPVTVLFGRAPSGLNATGESDLEYWYAEVISYQQHIVRPILNRIVRLAARSVQSSDPGGWSVTFPSLWVESPSQTATKTGLIATRDVAYIGAGVWEPEEVAIARAQGWDTDPVIDEDSRRAMLELDRSKDWEEPTESPIPPVVPLVEGDDEPEQPTTPEVPDETPPEA
jgi:phage-related protein (TIGR01555 family)